MGHLGALHRGCLLTPLLAATLHLICHIF
ncbi:rCG24946 [Rattus norvegicus]|uniref:RCG24946 n=1 Tax=Rattus norvegicus TaxID=10116 RepID=A6KLU8_RAT|nr:rCG24946 [Rattus norvegicus]